MTVPGENWVVEWTYSPADYFEEPREVSHEDYNLIVKDGKAEARTSRDPRPELCEQLGAKLEFRFQGVQLVSHKPYELSTPSVSCHHANGERDLFVEVSNGIGISNHVDRTVTDANGTVVADTQAERIQRKRFLGDLAVKHCPSDPLARELLLHYGKAMNDRDHFLVHLYDITEALKRHFSGQQRARAELQMTKAQWSELRKLANDPGLRQGRHRACAEPSKFRNAAKHEWDTAMNIAAEIVEKYLKYLDDRRT